MGKFITKAATLRTWLITLLLLAAVAAGLGLYAADKGTGIDSILNLLAG